VAPRAGGARVGRLRVGVARAVGSQRLGATLAAGATVGDLWSVGSGHRTLGASLRLTVLDLVAVSGALGAERDPFGGGDWLGFWSVGLGLTLGPIGADVRRGGIGATQAAPTAVSVRYELMTGEDGRSRTRTGEPGR